MSTHHHSVIFVVSKRLMTENAVSCCQNKKSFENDLVTWWMQIVSHWIPPKFELNWASKTFEKLSDECDDINGFAVFYNSRGNCVGPRLELERSVSWGTDCLWGHFGASSASMRRKGSGVGICDLGSRIWGARTWECPCESQLLPAESDSALPFWLFPKLKFFTDSWNILSRVVWLDQANLFKSGIWRYWHCE